MSEQKMREALQFIRNAAYINDDGEWSLNCLFDMGVVDEALAQPADVGLTANEMTTLFAIKEACLQDYDDVISATMKMHSIALVLSELLTRHEAKKNGGGV